MRNYLEELNESQYQAVTSDSQYLRIIAGAGSGKTRVLTYRIAYLIEELGVRPWNILAITFTNKVAKEMKERAAKLIDGPVNDLCIRTFHSFCAYFLRHEINVALDYPSNFIIYDEVDTKEKIKEACVKCGIEKKDKLVNDCMNYIWYQKEKGKYPNEIKPSGFRWPDEKKCLEVYYTYESLKFDDRALDFDDLIMKTIQILKNFPHIQAKWQNYYRYILIDEFQDTNDLQYELLKLLMSTETSLYVVGDPDQTIYSWRGANQDIILDLNKTFPSLETIILDKNYRSTKTILNVSNKLIKHNKYRVEKNLITDNEQGSDVEVFDGYTRKEEANWVVKKIVTLKAENPDFSYNDVAILYRNAYLSSSIEEKLVPAQIPYVVYGGVKFYQRREVKLALSYFRLALNLDEDFSFYKVINEPKRKIGEASVLLIQEESKRHGLSGYQYIRNIENYPDTKLKFSATSALNLMFEKIEYAHSRLIQKQEAVVAILRDLLESIGLFDYLLTLENGEERIQNVDALFDQLTSFFKENQSNDLNEFLENISLASAQDEVADAEKIKLMTIHTAKGLEFKYVFVIGVSDGVFPSRRTMEENPMMGLEEERRLCYVAFTRARKKLFVSSNRDYSYVNNAPLVPSRFFKEAGLTFIKARPSVDPLKQYSFLAGRKGSAISGAKPLFETKKSSGTAGDWKVGDRLRHKNLGEGKVIDIVNDILVIDFQEHGIKKIICYFKGLEKINGRETEV